MCTKGRKISKFYDGSVTFFRVPSDCDPARFKVSFTNLVCDADCDGNIAARFEAELSCPTVAQMVNRQA